MEKGAGRGLGLLDQRGTLVKMIFYHVKKGLSLSIFAYFIFVETKFKPTKKQKQSSDLYSLLLLYPAGGNSLFLLHPVSTCRVK